MERVTVEYALRLNDPGGHVRASTEPGPCLLFGDSHFLLLYPGLSIPNQGTAHRSLQIPQFVVRCNNGCSATTQFTNALALLTGLPAGFIRSTLRRAAAELVEPTLMPIPRTVGGSESGSGSRYEQARSLGGTGPAGGGTIKRRAARL